MGDTSLMPAGATGRGVQPLAKPRAGREGVEEVDVSVFLSSNLNLLPRLTLSEPNQKSQGKEAHWKRSSHLGP